MPEKKPSKNSQTTTNQDSVPTSSSTEGAPDPGEGPPKDQKTPTE